MSVIHGTEEQFNELINTEFIVVDFYAEWCGPCKMLGSVLEQLDDEILKIDVDECPDLARKYGIMSVPTLMIFTNGILKSTKSGFMSKEELEKWINSNKENG